MKTWRKWGTFLKIICITFILVILLAEGLFRYKGISLTNFRVSIEPRSLFLPDTILGWLPATGKYSIYLQDSMAKFSATVDAKRNRISSHSDTLPQGPLVQIYGCSCTFGFSVEDSATQSFQLQKMYTNKIRNNIIPRIENKGVPGYGLTQMFLLLQKSLEEGDKPRVVVFNYNGFHDMRLPMSHVWSGLIGEAISQGEGGYTQDIHIPYYTFDKDKAILNTKTLDDINGLWPLSRYSSLALMANFVYAAKQDEKQAAYFHQLAHLTILEMMAYCRLHGIIPILANLRHSGDYAFDVNMQDDIFNDVAAKGYYVLDYGIDIGEGTEYNCSPHDPAHPNAKAHKIYSEKLFAFIQENKLLE